MAGRPHTAVPNIFVSEGAGIPNNIPLLDADFADVLSFYNDSAIGWVNYVADTGTANAYVATLAAAPSAYIAGMTIALKVANKNTGASTINVNSLGSQSITTPAGNPLLGGELVPNAVIKLVYDGTNFRIIGPCPAILSGTFSANTNLECAGCTSVHVDAVWTAGSLAVFLLHLAPSVPVTISYFNNSGSTSGFGIGATDPSGTNFTNVNAVTAGGIGSFTNMLAGTGNVTLSNGLVRVFSGSAAGLQLFLT